jgi:hypothetical protein
MERYFEKRDPNGPVVDSTAGGDSIDNGGIGGVTDTCSSGQS